MPSRKTASGAPLSLSLSLWGENQKSFLRAPGAEAEPAILATPAGRRVTKKPLEFVQGLEVLGLAHTGAFATREPATYFGKLGRVLLALLQFRKSTSSPSSEMATAWGCVGFVVPGFQLVGCPCQIRKRR